MGDIGMGVIGIDGIGMSAQVLVEEIDGAPPAHLKIGVFSQPAGGDIPKGAVRMGDISMGDIRLEAIGIDGIGIDRMGIDGIDVSRRFLLRKSTVRCRPALRRPRHSAAWNRCESCDECPDRSRRCNPRGWLSALLQKAGRPGFEALSNSA